MYLIGSSFSVFRTYQDVAFSIFPYILLTFQDFFYSSSFFDVFFDILFDISLFVLSVLLVIRCIFSSLYRPFFCVLFYCLLLSGFHLCNEFLLLFIRELGETNWIFSSGPYNRIYSAMTDILVIEFFVVSGLPSGFFLFFSFSPSIFFHSFT